MVLRLVNCTLSTQEYKSVNDKEDIQFCLKNRDTTVILELICICNYFL